MSVRHLKKFKVDWQLTPGTWLTAEQRLMKGIWPWTEGPRSRLPRHYKLRYIEKYMKEPLPVNFRKIPDRFERQQENIPIPIKHPDIADEGLWGGEGVVEGLYRSKNRINRARYINIWKPNLMKKLFYSELLDKWMAITVTGRALEQIDECNGFDNYILSTHEIDMKSKLGMKLRRQMLYALHNKDFSQDDLAKQGEIYKRYEQYMIPYDEIEWLGLDIQEAENKLLDKEEDQRLDSIRPYKLAYMQQMVKEIEEGTFDNPRNKDKKEEATFIERIPVVGSLFRRKKAKAEKSTPV